MNRIFMAAAAAVALMASCSRVSDVTKVTGTVEGGDVEIASIVVPALDIDTTVVVSDGKFFFELPADVTVIGGVSAGQYSAQFIPDGTALEIVLGEKVSVTSKTPARSVQARFGEYQEKAMAIQDGFRTRVNEIMAKEGLSQEEKDALIDDNYNVTIEEFTAYNKQTLSENTDNIIAVSAMQNMNGMLEDSEIDSLVNILADKIRENEFVVRMQKGVRARTATAEGKMFTDFTVEDSDGKAVKFSDFVGKGKYVLVDFWASWCGPCKREIPNIKAVYDKYKGRNFDVLSVAVWDRPEDTKASAKEHGVNWKQIINAQSVPTELYGIDGIPHIMLIGPDGTIIKRNLRGDDIEAEVSKYVKAKR